MTTVSTTKTNTTGNGESSQPALDKTGQFAVFASDATNLSSDTSGLSAIYLKNTQTGDLKNISNDKYGIAANTASLNPTISGDGRYVIFESTAVVSTDFNGSILFPSFSDFDSSSQNNKGGVNNLFLKNTQTSDLTLVTPNFGDGDSINAEITSDGRNVVFQSLAANFISNDTNGAFDIYVEDLQTKTLKLVSSDASGTIGNRASVNPSVSADGLKVAFASDADNFLGFNNVTMNLNATPWLPTASVTANNINVSVPVDNNANRDVFVKNVNTGAIQLVSANYKGGAANGVSDSPSISADGTKVVFRSFATNLIANLVDAVRDGSSYVYLKDLNSNTLTQIDLLSDSKLPNGSSWNPQISPDGKFVAFISDATNLVSSDNNGVADVFLKNLSTGELKLLSDNSTGTGNVVDFAFSGDSSTLAFSRLSGLEDNATTNVYSTQVQAAIVVNNLPTGSVTISGTTKQGQTLTASNSLADLDGLGTISYQWLSGGNVISGATQSSYTLTTTDVGKTISVKASYTDLKGTAESMTSSATAVVIGSQDTVPPINSGFAKTLLSNRLFTVSDNDVAVVGGTAGNEVVRIQSGVTNITFNANIERVELSNALSSYKFISVSGVGVEIWDTSSKIATIPSLNQDTKIAFSNGTAILAQTGAADFKLGNSAISSSVTSTLSNVSLDTMDLSGSQNASTSTGFSKTMLSNRTFTVSDNDATVIGGTAGNEIVRIQAGVTSTTLNANIERIELSGALSVYKFISVSGVGVEIWNSSSKIVTIPSLNQDSKIAFSNGTAVLTQTGASDFKLGNAAIASSVAAAPSNVLLDSNDLSSIVSANTTLSATNLIATGTAGVDTFNILLGTYNATIDGFAAGDKLKFFTGASFQIEPDTNQSDGVQQLTASNASATTTITLTGLTPAQDSGIFNVPSFNTLFGSGSIA